jgi:hypothetical protein
LNVRIFKTLTFLRKKCHILTHRCRFLCQLRKLSPPLNMHSGKLEKFTGSNKMLSYVLDAATPIFIPPLSSEDGGPLLLIFAVKRRIPRSRRENMPADVVLAMMLKVFCFCILRLPPQESCSLLSRDVKPLFGEASEGDKGHNVGPCCLKMSVRSGRDTRCNSLFVVVASIRTCHALLCLAASVAAINLKGFVWPNEMLLLLRLLRN